MMDAEKLILNPARLRILQYIRLHGNVRTSEISAYLCDIPRATVYHHVKILEENKIIKVVKENRIRGAIEKIYALQKEDGTLIEDNTAVALSTAFHMGLMQEMNEYFERNVHDYKKDQVLFSTALLYMNDMEYDHLLLDIADLLKPYVDRAPQPAQRLRKLSIISSPPETKKEIKKGDKI